jgi:hypothetical protein
VYDEMVALRARLQSRTALDVMSPG